MLRDLVVARSMVCGSKRECAREAVPKVWTPKKLIAGLLSSDVDDTEVGFLSS